MDRSEFVRLRREIIQTETRQREQRLEAAWDSAQRVALWLREKFGVSQVYLYGSLAWGGFWEHSDIDLLAVGFASEKDFWAMQAGADWVGRPFEVNIVLEEDAPPSLRDKAIAKGVKLLEPA